MRQNNHDPNNKRNWFTNLTIVDALYQGLVGEDKEQHVFQGEAFASSLAGRVELSDHPIQCSPTVPFTVLLHARCQSCDGQ